MGLVAFAAQVCTAGDRSAMYDEVDPILACDKAELAISCLQEWTGRTLCAREWLNMSYSESNVAWGKPIGSIVWMWISLG